VSCVCRRRYIGGAALLSGNTVCHRKCGEKELSHLVM
jgi:hypothetical protein